MSRVVFLLLCVCLLAPGCAHRRGHASAMGAEHVRPHHGRDARHAAHASKMDPMRGFSAERLARINDAMQQHVDNGVVSGVVTLVQRNGKIVYRGAVGFQDREARTPMRDDTIFRIYSMSKPITSVAIMMLVEEGKLRLTEPVDRLLPELANPVVLLEPTGPLDQTRPATRPITVRDLLAHSSGLAYAFTSTGPLSEALTERGLTGSSSKLPSDQWIAQLGSLPLLQDPGTKWHYSLSTDVLGVLVERASGMSLADFFRTRIFEPLGMADTAFFVPADKLPRFAVNYENDPESGEMVVFDHPRDTRYAAAPGFASGGGGLVSTADDYLRFAALMTNGGEYDGVRLLSRKTVELMTSNALWPHERVFGSFGYRFFLAGQGFGLGVSVVEDLGMTATLGSVGMNGWGGAAGTWYWSDPQENLSAVVMIQQMASGASGVVSQDFRTLVYQALAD